MIYALIVVVAFLFAFIAYRYEKLFAKNKEILENYNKELESEIKKQTADLKKSNIKFNLIYNYSLDAIALLDIQSGKFSDVNPKAIELYGYTKEEFLNLKIIDIEASANEEEIKFIQENIIKSGWNQFESKHRLKDGSFIDVYVNAVAIKILDKDYLYITFKDITKEKQLEQNIILEKDFVSTIIDSANSIIAVIDHEGRMFRVNKYTEEFTGYTQEEISSEPYFWSRFLPEDKKEKVFDILKEANKGHIINSFKNSWFSKDKEERIFEWSNTLVQKEDGTMDYIATIGIDVTQQEYIQKLILDKKKEFEAIFKYAQDGIAIVDLEGNFLKFNDSFKNLLEYSDEELLTKNSFDLTSPPDREKNINAMQQAISTGHVGNFEKECITKNNKKITVHVSISLLPDKQTLLFIVKDTSSIKLLEEQSKLASMGEMIGNIAHQWRQPLSVITTSASALKLEAQLDMEISKEQIIEYSELAVQQSQYLSNTIDNFRNFLKGDNNHKIIEIDEILNYTLALTEATIKNNNIKIIKEVENDLLINGSINELSEAFINILNNSKDILKEKVSNEEDRFIFIYAYKKTPSQVVIPFKDTGGGIPDDIINRIFEPYFTSKHQSIGTGLGLAMADKIIRERHHGSICVSNEEYEYEGKTYKGACFLIVLNCKVI